MSELTAGTFGTAAEGAVQANSGLGEVSPSASHVCDRVLADSLARAAAGRPRSAFQSILYMESAAGSDHAPPEAPACFRDLNLDQIIEAITSGREEYDLKPFFHDPVKTIEAIRYRQEVMHDLEDNRVLERIKTFAGGMRLSREKIVQANKLYYKYQKERWFLHAVDTYCAAVRKLSECLSRLEVSSRGLLTFLDYVADYADSDRFGLLLAAANKLTSDLASVQYSVLIKGNGFKVRKYDAERDYSVEVVDTFKKFQQGAAKDYRVEFLKPVQMNHIEEKVHDFVALLHPEIFANLDAFVTQNGDYADPILARFDREIQFYISYSEYIGTFKCPSGDFASHMSRLSVAAIAA